MRLFIKKMVHPGSIGVVEKELNALRIQYDSVERGVVKLKRGLTDKKRCELKTRLLSHDLELVGERQHILIERVSSIIKEFAGSMEDLSKTNYSDYIRRKLNNEYAYGYVSVLFSKIYGVTLERAIISLKIERVRELLIHSKLNITEI